MQLHLYPHIIADPNILSGKPIIEGTQVPASALVEQVASGRSIADVARDHDVSPEDVRAALEYAARRADEAVAPPAANPALNPTHDDAEVMRSPEAQAEAQELGLDPSNISPLGWRLLDLRAKGIAAGEPRITSWEDLAAEIAERRGGNYPDTDE